MEAIETREGYFARITGAKAEVYTKSNVCLTKNAKVLYLKEQARRFEVVFQEGWIIIGCEGLLGGGNCSGKSESPTASCRRTASKPESSAKRLHSSHMNCNIIEDNTIEARIKNLLAIFTAKLKAGNYGFSIIKEIEYQKPISTYNFLSMCEEILKVLCYKEIYYDKKGLYLRYKLSVLAKHFLCLHCITSTSKLEESQELVLKELLLQINKSHQDAPFPELCFNFNIILMELLISNIHNPISDHLKPLFTKMLLNYYKDSFKMKSAITYINTSANLGRSLVTDIIFLEVIDCRKALKILNQMLDLSTSEEWEYIASVLLKLACGVEETTLLAEYLYFSNFEIKDVWKIRYIALELLIQNKELNHKSSSLIHTVIRDKVSQDEDSNIKKLLKNHEFYQYAVSLYNTVEKPQGFKDPTCSLPNFTILKCDTSKISLLLNAAPQRILTITGQVGSGKTNLALNYAYNNLSIYSLIHFIPSQSISTINYSFLKLLQKLKLIKQETLEETISVVLRNLQQQAKPFLLIFDNASSLNMISHYIPYSGHILITSTSDEWELTYQIPPLDEGIIKKSLGDSYSKDLSEVLDQNYMCVNLAVKLLHSQEISITEMIGSLRQNKGLTGIFFLIVEMLNRKIEGSKDFLYCLAVIENSYVPKELSVEVLSILRAPSYNYDLIIAILSNYGLIDEAKGQKILMNSSFYQYLSSSVERITYYVGILKLAYFSLYHDVNSHALSKAESNLFLLINKFSNILSNANSLDAVVIFVLIGKYKLYMERDISQAIKNLEYAALCVQSDQIWTCRINFALGYCYLREFQFNKSQSLFQSVIDSEIDAYYKFLSSAFLVSVYESIGNSIKVSEIILNLPNIHFSEVIVPEAVYCVINGMCNLSLDVSYLEELLQPYSSFLSSQALSFSLTATLLNLAFTFSVKNIWKNVLEYVNLLAVYVNITGSPGLASSYEILQSLESILLKIKHNLATLEVNTPRILSLIHLILAKVYSSLEKSFKQKENLLLALQILTVNSSRNQIFIAEVHYELSLFYLNNDKNVETAMECINYAESLIVNSSRNDSLIYSKIHGAKGLIYLKCRDFFRARASFENSLKLKQKILSLTTTGREELSDNIASMARLEEKLNNSEFALKLYLQALISGNVSFSSLKLAKRGAKLSMKMKKLHEALKFKLEKIHILEHNCLHQDNILHEYTSTFEIAMKIKEYELGSTLAENSLSLARMLNLGGASINESVYLIRLADSLIQINNHIDAEKYLKEAMETSLKIFGPRSSEFNSTKYSMGMFLRERDRYAEAITCFNDILKDSQGIRRGNIQKEIGICYMKLKNTEEAIPVFHEALASFEENNCLIEVGKTCYLYSQCLENSTAIIYLKRSLSALVESLGKEDPFTLEVLQKLQEKDPSC